MQEKLGFYPCIEQFYTMPVYSKYLDFLYKNCIILPLSSNSAKKGIPMLARNRKQALSVIISFIIAFSILFPHTGQSQIVAISISESTFLAAGGEKYIKYSEVKEITVKGKSIPLKVYIVEEVLPMA